MSKPWTFTIDMPLPKYFCCGEYCPGLSYMATEMKHPESCNISPETPPLDEEEYFRFHKNFPYEGDLPDEEEF